MNKSLIVFLIIFLIAAGTINVFAKANEVNSKEFDLNQAISRVLQENAEVKEAEQSLEKAKLEYQIAEINNLREQSNYSELEAEYNLKSSKKNYLDSRNEIIKETINQYSNVYLDKLNMTVLKKVMEAEKMLYEQYKSQNKLGEVTNIDLLEQFNNYQDAKFDYETAEDQYLQSLKQLKLTLALDLESNISVEKLSVPEILKIGEKEALSQALNNNLEIKLGEISNQLKKIDQARSKITDSKLNKKIDSLEIEISNYNLKALTNQHKISAQDSYYSYQQAAKNMKLKKEKYQESKSQYQLMKEKHQLGMSTKTDLLQYEANMLEAEYDYKSSISELYLAEQSLKEELFMDTGVFDYEN
jgi:outer membrane protein TolC